MTPQHTFILAAIGALLVLGAIFWCGWVARDGQINEARAEARLAESFAESARKSAEQWESNSDKWEERATAAESKLDADELQLSALENQPASITRPSASAPEVPPASKPGRARGARGRFIKA